ncbi:Lrp/AsnC family transcriptional regulator [Spirillospora sp. CA-108201]
MPTLDSLDRAVVHALQLDGRAPFTKIAAVVGSSTQTVVRRYRRLHAEAGLRVVGLADPRAAGRRQWIVRLTATARAAQDIAQTLARRPDTSWVRLTSGGTEIVAIIHTGVGDPDSHALLLRDIPRTASITAVSAHYMLHTYVGGPAAWPGRVDALTGDQKRRLQREVDASAPPRLTPDDERMVAALREDGRANYADLARATGQTAATVTRRLHDLRARGAIFFDVDLDPGVVDITTSAVLWMAVAPAHLERVATELATHRELAVVAATTGRTNLMAHALCRDTEDLHHYLTRRLAIDAITGIETAPVLRTLKTAATLRP